MKRNVAFLALGLACSLAMAQGSAPSWQNQGGTPYLTGGVGEEELASIKTASGDSNVRLLLAEKGGAYVTGARVVIAEGAGKTVLDVNNAGAYLLAKLPRGAYRIDVTYEGRSQSRRVDVREGGPAMIAFYW